MARAKTTSARATRSYTQKAAQKVAISQRNELWEPKEARWVEAQEKADFLLQKPTEATSTYLDKQDRPKFDDRFLFVPQRVCIGKDHPKLLHALKTGAWTYGLQEYYEEIAPLINMPLAGISLEPTLADRQNELKPEPPVWVSGKPERNSEDNFHNRPSIKLPLPDHLKAILVDDWENVTKLQQLVPLPHAHPVEEILGDYLAHERPNRQEGSASMDILEETVAGLREYFDKALGRILLYRFERAQYHEMHQLWNSDESKQKNAGDTYGAEHLARLLVSLPELVAQTNMDQQSVNRLREELMKFTNWFSRQVTKYFVSEYETPAADYHEKARSA